ncbi:hypothetical protein L226DRAFT_492889 [Lentinus tigrinus ALCF2SS1-7]|uniref:Uncharacterized protein n=1 Tax=Lentinus tigrinus ALCF2SS1-6 TaxID=1328759 RepID=A0A5C2S369_9APHY|nr:hypothetical protein L227DRAFT_551416 [Lentinus tigrinus ALCF2SS1-6]RPD70400.1 hypothetical protein L226DRAFT_492889 [Lentinus tigrinus ALCF2SS1-7]
MASDNKLLAPLPRHYAVICLLPVEMVQHLKDPVAMLAAETMSLKKYLVLLDTIRELPMPGWPWFRYGLNPIATSLRLEDPQRFITSDMAVPIYPNTSHPTGRSPVHPATPFPFSNCYHWINYEIVVRVKAVEGGWDHSHAISIGNPQFRSVEKAFNNDWVLISRLLEERHTADSTGNVAGTLDDAGNPASPSPYFRGIPGETHSGAQDTDNASSTFDSNAASSTSITDFFGDDVDPHAAELLPLVDLWLEVTEHVGEDTIQDPQGLFQERDAIALIILDARKRIAERKAAERKARIQQPHIDPASSSPVSADGAALQSELQKRSPTSSKPEVGLGNGQKRSASYRKTFARILRKMRALICWRPKA